MDEAASGLVAGRHREPIKFMTFRTLSLEEYGDEEAARKSYECGASTPAIIGLNAYTWPTPADDFARVHCLPIEYIDNVWIRVVVTAALARRFLESGASTEVDAESFFGRIKDGCWYVIEEEEF